MSRWGMEGMGSFEQPNVARKEGERLAGAPCSHPAHAEASANI